jgi:rubrerythrin
MGEDTYSLTETWQAAIKAEQDAHDFYVKLSAKVRDAATAQLLRSLAEEEAGHRQRLEDEYRRIFEADM